MIKTFEFLINTGVQSLEYIPEGEKKASICAELAKAIALSGALNQTSQIEDDTNIEEKVKTKKTTKKSKKESLKTENQKEETVTPIEEITNTEVVEQQYQQPVIEEIENVDNNTNQEIIEEEITAIPEATEQMTDSWTEEMCRVKAEQLELLNRYVEAWGDEYVYNECLRCFSENTFVGAENVRPSNIDGFIYYLNELAQQFAQQ